VRRLRAAETAEAEADREGEEDWQKKEKGMRERGI